jgi:hypothetical protein
MFILGIALLIVLLVVVARSIQSRSPSNHTEPDAADYSNEPDCLADDEANYDPASDTEPECY